MKTVFVIVMHETGKIVFASENGQDFAAHKLVKQDDNDRFPIQVSEQTETALESAITGQFKAAYLFREDSDLTKKGSVFFEIEGNVLVEKTFAVETPQNVVE